MIEAVSWIETDLNYLIVAAVIMFASMFLWWALGADLGPRQMFAGFCTGMFWPWVAVGLCFIAVGGVLMYIGSKIPTIKGRS